MKLSQICLQLLFLLPGVTALPSLEGAECLDRIQVRGRWLVDASGRVRLFHGFNSVRKGPPWYDSEILNVTKVRLYRDWGFNAVRLGTMWKGVEPSAGEFDSEYLSRLQEIVKNLEDHGMYAILDMHQDVFSIFNTSAQKVGYEGVPLWLLEKFPAPNHPYPWPLPSPPSDDVWAEGYLTGAVSAAFQQLYNNTAGAVDYMSRFWAKVAATFRNQSSVLGYELINEPWAGDIYHFPVLYPGVAGRRNLAPLYNQLNSAIREVDKVTMVFYEPVTWGILSSGKILGSGFDSVPGGSEFKDRSVLSYHYYCWILGLNETVRYSPWKKLLCDKILGPRVFNVVLEDLQKIGGSSFLTEFGLCAPDGNPESVGTVECEFVLSKADEFLQSWTYWDSGFFAQSGEVNWNVVRSFARVYARAIAGIPRSMNFDLETKRFRLEYILDTGISAPTEIFIPLLHYPEGFNVRTSKQLAWKFDKANQVLHVMVSSDSLVSNSESDAYVDISPI